MKHHYWQKPPNLNYFRTRIYFLLWYYSEQMVESCILVLLWKVLCQKKLSWVNLFDVIFCLPNGFYCDECATFLLTVFNRNFVGFLIQFYLWDTCRKECRDKVKGKQSWASREEHEWKLENYKGINIFLQIVLKRTPLITLKPMPLKLITCTRHPPFMISSQRRKKKQPALISLTRFFCSRKRREKRLNLCNQRISAWMVLCHDIST